MSNNKKAYNIHQLAGKHPYKIWPIVKTYAAPANVLKNYKLVYEYVRIYYLSKYSKYAEGLLINMSHFYIHHGLPWKTLLFFAFNKV